MTNHVQDKETKFLFVVKFQCRLGSRRYIEVYAVDEAEAQTMIPWNAQLISVQPKSP